MNLTVLFEEILLLIYFVDVVYSSPLQFPEQQRNYGVQQNSEGNSQIEGRIFHPHIIKKKVKKKLKRRLLQCLLSNVNHRSANSEAQPQGRTFFINIYDIDINSSNDGGQDSYENEDDNNSNGEGGNCGDLPSTSGLGAGINHLGSLVGHNPLQGITGIGNDIKPVHETPERLLNRYFFLPLYRSLRPLYNLF